MAKRPSTRSWKQEEIDRLIALADAGATLLRASAALQRTGQSVQKKARELGKSFASAKTVRANLVSSGAIDASKRRKHPTVW
jgi:hypothetical protein